MSYLLAISVGPVQEFIAAARRTRDLWFGSHLLSEISRAVAIDIEASKGKLIFPASSKVEEIESLANVILAELQTGDPAAIARSAKEAAKSLWHRLAKAARELVGGDLLKDPDAWDDQVDDVIEFSAAWVKQTSDYPKDRNRLMQLLGARKKCRDFRQPTFSDAGLPKSSLDGQRPTVLRDRKGTEPGNAIRKKLRLSDGEQLDVVGVVKRLGQGLTDVNPRFSSVTRVAADVWLQGKAGELGPLRKLCKELELVGLNRTPENRYEDFPFEGAIVFNERHRELAEELGAAFKDRQDEVVAELVKLGGSPLPYLAVLVADGDGMGEIISNQDSTGRHQDLSKALSQFSGSVRDIVERHRGTLIYAGGDDVVALLPLNKCLCCASRLHEEFGVKLKDFKNGAGRSATLSVGLAIGHFMESLEDLRSYALEAEQAAKRIEGKNALAVHLHKRGGAPIKIAASWDHKLDVRLLEFAWSLKDDAVSGRLPYELQSMAKFYEGWKESNVGEVLKADLRRLISKKQLPDRKAVEAKILEAMGEPTAGNLFAVAQMLLVARLIAVAFEQSKEKAS